MSHAHDEADRIYRQILDRAPEHDFDPTIERVKRTVDLLGNPQRAYRVIHLTGTNGKTSTSRMVERLVREHGLRTGRFTSPHLSSVRERIAIDGEPISPEAFVAAWYDVAPYVEMVDAELSAKGQSQLSFFEVLTVMALAAFADAPVDVAILEVGMGGEWDSTNVADAEVAIVTPVAMDHERWLGHDLVSIAEVKAGIVKDGTTLVSATQHEDVESVLMAAAARHGSRYVREGIDIEVIDRQVAVGGQLVALRGLGGVYTEIFLPMHGAHQAHNALLALVAAEALLTGGSALDPGAVELAFADVDSPGRLELVRRSPAVIVDAAHNPSGASALVAALDEAFALRRVVGVVGVLDDKDAEGILGELEPHLAEIVVTRSGSHRALEPHELAEIAIDVFGEDRVHVAERLDNAIALAVELAERDESLGAGVLVTGSITVVAEARALFGRP
ncbi:MAG: bifunctional folylpolyglutamate synthase/dihydrofolate synthase [Actinomycetota bacterium]|nr:bifunctional folylpolyglutamate synthase/dihydrofolate synthase [Actinomycetota bacterium]